MRRHHVRVAVAVTLAVWSGVAAVNGCAAVDSHPPPVHGSGGTGGLSFASAPATGGSGGAGSASGGQGGDPMLTFPPDASDGAEDVPAKPCGSQCGPAELCDPSHTGLDDNCNGLVDEGCSCTPGSVHWCFRGDPSYRNTPGCFDGSMTCSELGQWGPCTGGVHALPPDDCFLNDTTACHAITSLPGATVDLHPGTGDFSANATPGSESFAVVCPTGVSQCPTVMAPASFTAVQSGEYTVTYTKQVAGDPTPRTCTFPLLVGARGLRVELSWEHSTADQGVDLDLHVHQPVSNDPWGISPGRPQDCTWSSCKVDQIQFNDPVVPHWFPDIQMAPDPCNWDVEQNPQSPENTCYDDPRGVGNNWRALGRGCHNPRLDIDNIQCNFAVTDPDDPAFCTPENVNVDYPPLSQWFRVGVHYYYNHGRHYDVHPEIKIFCDGALSADLGPHSYSMPEAPVTFSALDGAGTGYGNRFWLAADVAFTKDACGNVSCVVAPLYADPTARTPLFVVDSVATSTFDPPWPPPPQ